MPPVRPRPCSGARSLRAAPWGGRRPEPRTCPPRSASTAASSASPCPPPWGAGGGLCPTARPIRFPALPLAPCRGGRRSLGCLPPPPSLPPGPSPAPRKPLLSCTGSCSSGEGAEGGWGGVTPPSPLPLSNKASFSSSMG